MSALRDACTLILTSAHMAGLSGLGLKPTQSVQACDSEAAGRRMCGMIEGLDIMHGYLQVGGPGGDLAQQGVGH